MGIFLVTQDVVLSDRAKFQLIINFFRVKAISTGLNLEIVGIPVQNVQNTNAIVIEEAKLLDVNLTPEQTSTSHRLPAKNRKNISPPIIARFTNRDVRNKIYANRKATRTASFVNFSVLGTEKVYVNENLTRPHKKSSLANKAKGKKGWF